MVEGLMPAAARRDAAGSDRGAQPKIGSRLRCGQPPAPPSRRIAVL
ncbi:hypothetical protein [Nonomuraea dietziae]